MSEWVSEWVIFNWISPQTLNPIAWLTSYHEVKIKKNLWEQGSLGWRRRIKDVHPYSSYISLRSSRFLSFFRPRGDGARLGWAKKLGRSREGVSKKGEGVGRTHPLSLLLILPLFRSFPPVRERLEKERKRLLRRLLLYGSKSVAHPHSAHLHHWMTWIHRTSLVRFYSWWKRWRPTVTSDMVSRENVIYQSR